MPELSIIMPVYNAERTVGKMIDSIIAQTFSDWELIVVNDGSIDNSGRILDSYGAKDSRIKVIHKTNGGVAAARQDGIEHATGVYTIHADSDDWVEPNMLADMLAVAKSENADIVIADFFTDVEGCRSKLSVQCPESLDSSSLLRGLYTNDLFGGLWNKLIKKSVYDKADARFVKGINYCEDLLLLTRILVKLNPTISYLPKAYYHYTLNDTSLTRKVSPKGYESLKSFHNEVLKIFPTNEEFVTISKSFPLNEFIILFTNRLYQDSTELRNKYKEIVDIIKTRHYGIRWKLGFWCINHKYVSLAHKLIKL